MVSQPSYLVSCIRLHRSQQVEHHRTPTVRAFTQTSRCIGQERSAVRFVPRLQFRDGSCRSVPHALEKEFLPVQEQLFTLNRQVSNPRNDSAHIEQPVFGVQF